MTQIRNRNYNSFLISKHTSILIPWSILNQRDNSPTIQLVWINSASIHFDSLLHRNLYMAEACFKAEALGILRHHWKQLLEILDTLFTWLLVFTTSSGFRSIHFVVLKMERTIGVCALWNVQCVWVKCPLVCVGEYSKDLFSVVQIILMCLPVGFSKGVFLSWQCVTSVVCLLTQSGKDGSTDEAFKPHKVI